MTLMSQITGLVIVCPFPNLKKYNLLKSQKRPQNNPPFFNFLILKTCFV